MYMEYIFKELCKKHISILTEIIPGTNKLGRDCINDTVVEYFNKNDFNPVEVQDLKYLIMIGNILYNRTDSVVLPIDNEAYDMLLNKYRVYDKNFQVGSNVIEFQSQVEDERILSGERQIIQPISFRKEEKVDEIREDFRNKLKSFDNHKLSFIDVFDDKKIPISDQYITKRTHDTEHHHPDLVGTLDKCKYVLDSQAIELDCYNDPSVKILERDFFVDHINRGIITPDQILYLDIELKYDGVSVEADCTDIVESARSRGDTNNGVAIDMTPILYGYRFPHNDVLKEREVGVKFEAIITNSNLEKFNIMRGKKYANCRTAIIGLFGASDAYKYRDLITLIPLAIDRDNVPEIKNREEEIALLNRLYKSKGEPLRHVFISGNYKTCLYLINKFAEEAFAARNYLDFMFDGIVVNYLDEGIRAKLGRENYINKYSMAVKFNPESKITTFLGYSYEVGQNGSICPMIHYTPVEFFGTIHPKSTGSGYNRFKKLNLKIGDYITVTYRNDVITYVTPIDCEHNRQNPNPPVEFPTNCPICGADVIISNSGKSAYCSNVECPGRITSKMSNMFDKLGIKGFSDATVNKLHLKYLKDIINLYIRVNKGDKQLNTELHDVLGIIATDLLNNIRDLLMTPTEDYKWIGAIGFTDIAAKTWKLIFSEFTLKEFVDHMNHDRENIMNKIMNISGIGKETVNTILREYDYFYEDINIILKYANILDSKNIKLGKQIRFTGCRNSELEKELRSRGYDCSGSDGVTKKTDILLVPYKGFSSTKINKVSENCMIIPIQEFIADMDKYL